MQSNTFKPNSNHKLYEIHSPLGSLYLKTHLSQSKRKTKKDTECIVEVCFDDETQLTTQLKQNAKPAPKMWQQAFDNYFAGELSALTNLPYTFTTGTDFEQSVWQALSRIKAGTSLSYGELAKLLDKPNAARAVGSALKKNPLPLLLPCHRILRNDGKLGGYQGLDEVGLRRKRYLLWHEGVLVKL